MTPNYNLCDVCGAKCDKDPLFVAVDRRLDAAGSSETVGDTWDVCGKCLLVLVRHLLSESSGYDLGVQVQEWLQKHQKR